MMSRGITQKGWVKSLISWLRLGVDIPTDYTMKRKVLHTNIGAAIGIVSLLLFHLLMLATGNQVMVGIVIYELPFYFAFYLIPWLNGKGLDSIARGVLTGSAMFSQIMSIEIGFGSMMDVHYYFIMFAIVPILIFPLRQWYFIIVLFVVNLGLFFGFEFNPVASAPGLQGLDGESIDMFQHMYAIGSFLGLLVFIWIAELAAESNEKKLLEASMTDMLTGLPNRRFFEAIFRQEVAKAIRQNQPVTLVLLDIDHFKRFNDLYGHDVGDAVLKFIAEQLRAATRAGNLISRVGGEEFTVLLPNTSLAKAREVAERIRHMIESTGLRHNDEVLKVTISAGVSVVDCNAPMEQSYKRADDAMYAAKNAGRNRVAVHEPAVGADQNRQTFPTVVA